MKAQCAAFEMTKVAFVWLCVWDQIDLSPLFVTQLGILILPFMELSLLTNWIFNTCAMELELAHIFGLAQCFLIAGTTAARHRHHHTRAQMLVSEAEHTKCQSHVLCCVCKTCASWTNFFYIRLFGSNFKKSPQIRPTSLANAKVQHRKWHSNNPSSTLKQLSSMRESAKKSVVRFPVRCSIRK